MRIARFTVGGADPRFGIVEGEEGAERIHVVAGDPLYTPLRPAGEVVELEAARLLAPVIPRSKVVGIGRNYAAHAAEMGGRPPADPIIFLKPNTAVIGPGEAISLPSFSQEVHHEAELAVVIGRICKDVPPERVDEVIFGYTVANDVSARDRQLSEPQWVRAKAFDTSCPLGPWIETDLDTAGAPVRAWVNGGLRQDGNTADMLLSVADLVVYTSSIFTLLPGDVILTGTPAGVGPIEAGDTVKCEVGGIGALVNPVIRRG
jgi:2-keto-4-pentenoate hydratase/2-oxohepta-3-ene-1,7-dioic acid hydratase in catechol pathway